MNKLYRLPLRTRNKNLSSGVRRRQNSSKIVATGILALCGLAALVAIGFAAFLTYKHMKGKPKAVSTTSVSPSPSPAATPTVQPKDVLMPLADPNKASSAATPLPSPSVLISTPMATPSPTPAPSIAPREQKTEAQPKTADKPMSKAARKSLEKKRLDAERKRAQLEKEYQNHEISTDAYNKGKEEYKIEIQKYRDELKSSK